MMHPEKQSRHHNSFIRMRESRYRRNTPARVNPCARHHVTSTVGTFARKRIERHGRATKDGNLHPARIVVAFDMIFGQVVY